jgi:hypothetical protein
MRRFTILLAAVAVMIGGPIARADGPPLYDTGDGAGLSGMNSAYPGGGESGYMWSLSLRYTKQKLLNFALQEHESNGVHKAGFLTTAMIPDGAVTEPKLSAGVQTKLNAVGGTNTTSTLLITNALTYVSSTESGPSQPATASEQMISTLTLSSNTFRKVLITAEATLVNSATGARTFTLQLRRSSLTGTTERSLQPCKVQANTSWPVTLSVVTTAENTTDVPFLLTAIVDNANSSSVIVHNFRLWGIP